MYIIINSSEKNEYIYYIIYKSDVEVKFLGGGGEINSVLTKNPKLKLPTYWTLDFDGFVM